VNGIRKDSKVEWKVNTMVRVSRLPKMGALCKSKGSNRCK